MTKNILITLLILFFIIIILRIIWSKYVKFIPVWSNGFIPIIIVLLILLLQYIRESPQRRIADTKLEIIKSISSEDAINLVIYSVPNNRYPNRDSLVITNKDTIQAIINYIKNAKDFSMSHPGVQSEIESSLNLKDGNKIQCFILNSSMNGTVIGLYSDFNSRAQLKTLRNDSLRPYINDFFLRIKHSVNIESLKK